MSRYTIIYHVKGYTAAGYFLFAQFNNIEDALAYRDCVEDWQNGEIAAGYFTGRDHEVKIFWKKKF